MALEIVADLETRQFSALMAFVVLGIATVVALGVWLAMNAHRLSCAALDFYRSQRQNKTQHLPKEKTMDEYDLPMRLFYIQADTDESHDRSLMVHAEMPSDAVALWREHYELDDLDDVDYGDARMTDIPSSTCAGVVDWEMGTFTDWGVA